jgi:hypothetical protein
VQLPRPYYSLQAVVASGLYHSTSCKILVFMDIALNSGDMRDPFGRKMDRIVENIGEANFTKALQKVRGVLGLPTSEAPNLRAEFIARC